MGQYFNVVNLTKRQYLHPHKFGEGLKLTEFGCSMGGTLMGLTILLSDGNGNGSGDLHVPDEHPCHDLIGSWAGDNIVICGDYADEGYFVPEELPDWPRRTLYSVLNRDRCYELGIPSLFEDISEKVLLLILEDDFVYKGQIKSYRCGSGGLDQLFEKYGYVPTPGRKKKED